MDDTIELTLKPNQNSKAFRADGTAKYEMVDLIDVGGAVWGSVNVDLFWSSVEKPRFYHDLFAGKSVRVRVEPVDDAVPK